MTLLFATLINWTFSIFSGLFVFIVGNTVINASKKVMAASEELIKHTVEIRSLNNNFNDHRNEVKEENEKIINLFTNEIDPIKNEVETLNGKVNKHGEKIVRIETHLKINSVG